MVSTPSSIVAPQSPAPAPRRQRCRREPPWLRERWCQSAASPLSSSLPQAARTRAPTAMAGMIRRRAGERRMMFSFRLLFTQPRKTTGWLDCARRSSADLPFPPHGPSGSRTGTSSEAALVLRSSGQLLLGAVWLRRGTVGEALRGDALRCLVAVVVGAARARGARACRAEPTSSGGCSARRRSGVR